MTDWPAILDHVAAAAKGALSSRPRLSRRSLVLWARREARQAAEIRRLSPRAAQEIDAIVDRAIEEASR